MANTRSPRRLLIVAALASLHVALTALPVLSPVAPAVAVRPIEVVRGAVAPYLNSLFLNHGYNFYAPEPGVSQALNVQITRDGQRQEIWMQDRRRYRTDLEFLRHQGLAKEFTGPSNVSVALATSVSRYFCRTYQADSVRITWALHPELPRELARTAVNPNASRFFKNPITVGHWTCES